MMNQNRVRDFSHSEHGILRAAYSVFSTSSDWCNAVHVTMTKLLIVPRRRGRGKIFYIIYSVRLRNLLSRLLQFFIALQLPHTCTASLPSSPSHHLDTQHTTYDHVHPSWGIREPGLCRCLQNLRRRSQCFLRGHHLHHWQWHSLSPPIRSSASRCQWAAPTPGLPLDRPHLPFRQGEDPRACRPRQGQRSSRNLHVHRPDGRPLHGGYLQHQGKDVPSDGALFYRWWRVRLSRL